VPPEGVLSCPGRRIGVKTSNVGGPWAPWVAWDAVCLATGTPVTTGTSPAPKLPKLPVPASLPGCLSDPETRIGGPAGSV
jgi:hypothetical protein